MKNIVLLSSLAILSITANAATNFVIQNNYGSSVSISNPSVKPVQDYSVANRNSLNLAKTSPVWGGLSGSATHIPMTIESDNKPLCSDSPFINHGILNMPKESGTLTISNSGTCTFKSSGQSSGKLVSSTIPDIGKVVMGQDYDFNNNPLTNLGFYIMSNASTYNYKDPDHSIHFSAHGLPKGLQIFSWGSPNFNPNYNGEIYGTATSTEGCTAVSGYSGYYKCPVTISASEPDVNKGKAITSTFNLYLYNGLTTKSLSDLAAYNQSNPNSPIRLNIGVNPSNTENIADISNLFTANNAQALNDITYSISTAENLSPINIINQQSIPTSDFSISSKGELSVSHLPSNSIVQFTVVAKNSLGQTAQETMYVNYSAENKNGVPLYTPSNLLPQATSAWVYGANSSDSTIQQTYLSKLKGHNVTYMTPDLGWIQLHGASDIWNMNTASPLDNNIGTSTTGEIQQTASYYTNGDSSLKFLITIEFDSKLKGILPVLTDTPVPGEEKNKYGQYTNQLQTLTDSIASSVLSSKNFAGMQFDIEPLPTQPRALEFYKDLSDQLARHGKVFELYGFANDMTPAMALAASPLTVWIPSMYDVGGYSNPSNYNWDTQELNYGQDTECHFSADGVNAYYTNSWCNLTVSDAAYQNNVLFNQKGQLSFAQLTSNYGVHFQLGVPAEGSALNWSQLEIWNPQKDAKGNFPSVVTGQKYTVKDYTYTDPTTKQKKTVQYYLFNSNLNQSTDKPSTQADYVQSDITTAMQNNLGTPKSNPLNLGLALYGLSNEKNVLGCLPGEKKGSETNCVVQLPVSISKDSPVWNLAQNYLQGQVSSASK